jgi:hypothetical protein
LRSVEITDAITRLWQENKKRSTVTLVIDVSGWMNERGRITNARAGTQELIKLLGAADSFRAGAFQQSDLPSRPGAASYYSVSPLLTRTGGRVSSALRKSREATLKILQQRLAHVDRREESIAEIDSDLTRIEAQVDLAVESAGLRGKQATVSTDIHFVSQFLDEGVFGEAGASITALESTYSEPPRRKIAE